MQFYEDSTQLQLNRVLKRSNLRFVVLSILLEVFLFVHCSEIHINILKICVLFGDNTLTNNS